MSAIDNVLSRFDGKRRSGSGWMVKCSSHEDNHASLSVTEGSNGEVLLHCHAGCATEDVLTAAGLTMADLFDDPPKSSNWEWEIDDTYDYPGSDGTLLFQVVRTKAKNFWQRRPDGNGGWIKGRGEIEPVLYRLPEVLRAAKAGEVIWIVEGEKDVHALESLGFVATTNPGGASAEGQRTKWRDSYSESLRGAERVVIVPDCDAPGRAHAKTVADSVSQVVQDVRIVELAADREDKFDVSDFIAVSRFTEMAELDLKALAASATRLGDQPKQIFALSLNDFVATKLDAPAALIGDDEDVVLPAHGLLILAGRGGKGKTTLAIEAALHLASGTEWLGLKIPAPLKVLFVENEGSREPFRRKLERKQTSWQPQMTGQVFVHVQEWGAFSLADVEHQKLLREFVVEEDVDLVIGDPLDMLGIEGVGSPEDTRVFVELMKEIGLFRDVAFWMLHHLRKEAARDELDELSGAWGGRPDAVLSLTQLDNNRARLAFSKLRWARKRAALILGFEPDTETFSVVAEEVEDDRDYVTELCELFVDGAWRTSREAAGKDNGIGAKHETVKETLEGHPELFVSRTGEAAREVGRRANATVWQRSLEQARPFEPVSLVGVSGGGEVNRTEPAPLPMGAGSRSSSDSPAGSNKPEPSSQLDQESQEPPDPATASLAELEAYWGKET